jgi:ribosome-associated toxin RatA of RatAB toxin-antitoxin module
MHGSVHQYRGSAGWAARALAALACGLGVFAIEGLPRVRASESREFSSEEEAQLRAGKLVVRAEQRTLGRARVLGGMSWQVIDAAPARVWQVLCDAHAYPHFLPAVEEAVLVESSGAKQSIFIRHRLGFITASYWVRAVLEPARGRLAFKLDHEHPSSIRDAWGELRVTPFQNQQSVVSLAIMADLGEGLFVGLARSNIHEWMLRIPEQLKRYVESHRN